MRLLLLACLLVSVVPAVYAVDGLQDVAVTHEITRLYLQLGVIILAARLGGAVAKRLHLPSLLGEVTIGVLLGPYALGRVPIPGFADGLVPQAPGAFAIPLQLFAFAAVGAVIHVLVVGLESDPGLLSRMRPRGLAVALGSSVLSLVVGFVVPIVFFGFAPLDRRVFFFAALSVSTSLGVQARIMHASGKMTTPEGAVIVGSSLMQDGFAIIVLAIAMAVGSVGLAGAGAGQMLSAVVPVAVIALVTLVGGSIVAFLVAPRLSAHFLKKTPANVFSVLTVAIALVVSAVFETFGVAAIIGAYIIGIAFSRTDVADILEEKTQPISGFFVPVLYVTMGMLVDFRVLFDPRVMVPGIGFAALSGLAKVVGSMIPALAGGFTKAGALRVGLGTVPRGEVALIIASVGLALGDYSNEIFQVMVVMVVVSVAVGSPAIALAFRYGGAGTRGTWGNHDPEITHFDFPNPELTDLIVAGVLRVAGEDGFLVHRIELGDTVYRLRRADVFLTLKRTDNQLTFETDPQDTGIAKTLVYEVIVHVRDRIARVTELAVPADLRRDVAAGSTAHNIDLSHYIDVAGTVVPLKATTKTEAIRELVGQLSAAGRLVDADRVLRDVLEREAGVSTGMDKGIAIPHGRSEGVTDMVVAVGLSPAGIDFQSIDGAPAHFVFLIVSPTDNRGPHLQLLAAIAKQMRSDERRARALRAETPEALIGVLV